MIYALPFLANLYVNQSHLLNLLLYKKKMRLKVRNDISNGALPPPEASSWAFLYKFGDDRSFINVLGISRAPFELLVSWFTRFYAIPFTKGQGGRPQKLSTRQSLALLLQFYAAPLELKSLAQLHGLRKNTASRILVKAEVALNEALTRMKLARIKWPSKTTQREWGEKVAAIYPEITGRFGFIDGKNYRVQTPTNVDRQNGWMVAFYFSDRYIVLWC